MIATIYKQNLFVDNQKKRDLAGDIFLDGKTIHISDFYLSVKCIRGTFQ